jgi:cyclophilin family peptidyl-prolyl cis-trans isomerase
MLQRSFPPTSSRRRTLALALPLVSIAALTACGGGGSGGGTPTATVTSTSVAATRYGDPALVTINGSGLDSSLAVSSAGCKTMTLLTAAPTASTSTTAYYSCTVSGAFSSTVVAKSNGTTVGTASFTVPAPVVTMAVSGDGVNGNLVITLKGDKAPVTVDNFLSYVRSGFYNGLVFHRVAPGFVIQGGGFGAVTSGTLPAPKPTNPPIALETTGGSNVQWTVAMARTSDPNSATSQFFINLVNNAGILDAAGYAVFGNLSTSSTAAAQAIVAAPCTQLAGATDNSCVPIPNVVITSATQTQ